MIRRSGLILIFVMIAGLVLAACNVSSTSDDADDDVDETPVATETPTPAVTETSEDDDPDAEETPAATAVADDEADPEAEETAEPWRLEPDPLLMIAESGEQRGVVGAFFWVDDTTLLALEGGPGYYERQEEPLEVEADETLEFQITTDKLPDFYEISVFEPNEDTTEGNRVVLGNEPILTEELDVDEPTWAADLEPGDYYVQVSTTWPTDDEMWHTAQHSQYRYWITVE